MNRGYTVTTGVWARDILARQYRVDLGRITWVVDGSEHVEAFVLPSNAEARTGEASLVQMLRERQLAAAIGLDPGDDGIRSIIESPGDAALRFLAEEAYYPINHLIVVRDDALVADPQLAGALCEVLADARDTYVQSLRRRDPARGTSADKSLLKAMQVVANPLPYGIDGNRLMLARLLEAMQQQRIITSGGSVEELFESSTRTMSL